MAKKKPRGFIATCQCGNNVGAMDFLRTDPKDAGKIIGRWLSDGCTVTPQFADFVVNLSACSCDKLESEANNG